MKKIGYVLAVVGAVWGWNVYNKDTTVPVPDLGLGYVTSQRVHNVGLVEDRNSQIMMSGFMFLAGIVLIGFGSIKREGLSEDDKDLMKKHGITRDDGKFVFRECEYSTLAEAVNHARLLSREPRSES